MVSLARAELAELDPPARREKLRREWARLLGDVEPASDPATLSWEEICLGDIVAQRIVLEVEREIVVPLLLLTPTASAGQRAATASGVSGIVLATAQEGKASFLQSRGQEVAHLLRDGIAVCLPELRGTGETATSDARGLRLVPSEDTVITPAELMLGQTMVGSRLRDLRSVLRYLRGRQDMQPLRVALWGDSFAPVNPADFEDPPAGGDVEPHRAEPASALLALLCGLFEDSVAAVAARRGLVGFASMLASAFFYVPHDVLVPGVLRAGDITDVAAALAPRPLCIEGWVDGRNRVVTQPELGRWLAPVQGAYADHLDCLRITSHLDGGVARWLSAALGTGDGL